MSIARLPRAAAIVAAAAIALVACSSGGSAKDTTNPTPKNSTAVARPSSKVTVQLKDVKGNNGPMTLTVAPNVGKAGTVVFTVKNVGTVPHELLVAKAGKAPLQPSSSGKVSEKSVVGGVRNILPGRTKTLSLKLAAGTYELFCNLKDHFAHGMAGPFVVR